MSDHAPNFLATNIPPHCAPTSPYLDRLSSAFHTCVPTSLALLSTTLGIFSIIAWLFAQVPQIYKNWRLQSASGLSIYFLLEWLAGDVTNLLGAALTGQASWQVGVAVYYVIVDVCLSGQYFWYCHIKPRHQRRSSVYDGDDRRDEGHSQEASLDGYPVEDHDSQEDTSQDRPSMAETKPEKPPTSDQSKGKTSRDDHFPQLSEKISLAPNIITTPISRSSSPPFPSKTLLTFSLATLATAAAFPTNPSHPLQPPIHSLSLPHNAEFAGRIFSWLSTALYLGSRLPQIYKNALRQSTAGLSPYMFLAAFCGNFFYSAAIIANPLAWASYPPYGGHGWADKEGSDRFQWVSLAAPFWLGAAGVLALDATVGLQFLVYSKRDRVEVLLQESKGRGRWRRVSGWMRGWVPAPSTKAGESRDMEEEESPLVARRASRSGSRGYGAT